MHEILSQLNVIFQSWGVPGLAVNAFVESFFLAPPPDFLLITMDLARPQKALFYATVCTMASLVGGTCGFFLGKFGGRPVFEFIFKNKQDEIHSVEAMYEKFGPYAVFFAAFTPIPFNVFTIASGILNMKFPPFFIAALVGRGMRFFIVSAVLMIFGEMIRQYLELVIIGVSALIIVFFFLLYKKRHLIK